MSRFARTARGPLGVYDDKVDAFKFYGDTKRILTRKAAQQPGGGIDLTEYIRRVLLVDAYGVEHMSTIARKQYESVRTKRDESGNAD